MSKKILHPLEYAKEYVKNGFYIIPLHSVNNGICTCSIGKECECPGKHPRTANGIKDATLDISTVVKWFNTWPNANIGIATGQISGIIAIDIDPRHNGDESFDKLIEELGELPETITQLTGGGGKHILLKYPDLKIRNKQNIRNGIDIKSDGGYIVASPSIHKSGKQYKWEDNKIPIKTNIDNIPQKWLEFMNDSEKDKASRSLQVPKNISDGMRNDTLFKIASSLWGKGLSASVVRIAVHECNNTQCDPPLSTEEVEGIIEGVLKRYNQGDLPKGDEYKSYPLTDAGNAQLIAEHVKGKYLYNIQRGVFKYYDGKMWINDSENSIIQASIEAIRNQAFSALKVEDNDKRLKLLKFYTASENYSRINAAIKILQSIPDIAVNESIFDNNDLLLNVQNGTIDLTTGILTSHKKEDYFTKICPIEYDANSKCPRFQQFLNEIFNGNQELIKREQRKAGYFLSGLTKEQRMFINFGSGANGKSTLIEIYKIMLGDYAVSIDVEALMSQERTKTNYDIFRLIGARLAICGEVEVGRKLAESQMKLLTGGDTITARNMYCMPIEFKNKAKILMGTNHLPRARGNDGATFRRLDITPFNVKFSTKNRDKSLFNKLIEELPGILIWAVDGFLNWQKNGLGRSVEVQNALRTYRGSQQTISDFLDECCERGYKYSITFSRLYSSYVEWCEIKYKVTQSKQNFSKLLAEEGLESESGTNNVTLVIGIKIKE